MLEGKLLKVPPREAPPPSRWGVAYRGVGEFPDAVTAVVRTLGKLGVSCKVSRRTGGVVAIEGKTRLPWYRLLAGHHPQRVRGRVEHLDALTEQASEDASGAGLRVSLDISLLPWYQRLVVGLWGGWGTGLSVLLWLTEPGELRAGHPLADLSLLATMLGLAIAAWVPHLLLSLGGARIQGVLWLPILRSVDAAGGYLEPEGSGVGRRFGLWILSYCVSFLVGGGALAFTAFDSVQASIIRGGFWSLALLVALVVLLFASALAIGVWRGFGLRVEAIILGIGSSVTALLLLATPLLLVLTADVSATVLGGRSNRAAEYSRFILGGTAIIPLLSAGLGVYILSISRYAWQPLKRTFRMRVRPGLYRTAVRGGALLGAARGFFGVYAAVVAGIVVAVLGLAALWAGEALSLVTRDSLLLSLPTRTDALLALAMGLPPDHSGMAGVVRAGWLVWAGLVWGLFGLSIGELVWKRKRLRRDLEEHAPGGALRHRTLVERKDRLLQGFRGPPVSLAVTRGGAIQAFSYRFSWPRRKWFIQVSEGALGHLTADELEALLAHELAHLRRRHVLCHDLVRWIGRIAFLGDGFSRGLLNSFEWESRADEEAVRLLGHRKEALVRCIWKIRDVNPRLDLTPCSEGLGIEAASPPSDRHERRKGLPRSQWAILWRDFLGQYVGDSELHYWHPGPDERADRIRRIDAMTDATA